MSPKCYVCGSATAPRRVGATDMVVCSRCGMGQVSAGATSSDYWARHDDAGQELAEQYWTDARTAVFRGALHRLAAGRAPGRLVDLGGGIGHFAACALELGWDAYSMDVSELASAAAARRLGPERSLSSVPSGLLGTCDAVTLWCVVAHVPDPRATVQEAVRLLKPGGRLFVTTPNFLFQAQYARLLGAVGRPLDFVAHDHLLHFTPAALDLILSQAGLTARTYTFAGVTEDCLFDRRLARWLVPVKRLWNGLGVAVSRLGLPALSSELQVVGVMPAPQRS